MCRGVYYVLEFKLKDGNYKKYPKINMKDLISEIKNLFNTEYNIDSSLISISNQVVFNYINPSLKRPVNKMISNYCIIKKL